MTTKSEVLTKLGELLPLQREWEELRIKSRATVFTSPWWTCIWLKHFQGQAPPKVLVLWEGGEMTGLAPLVTYRSSFKGYPITYLCMAGNFGETSEYYDLEFLHGQGTKTAAKALVSGIKGIRWNLLQLRNLRWNSMAQAFFAQASQAWRCEDQLYHASPYVPLEPARPVLDGFEGRSGRKVKQLVESLEREERLELRTVESMDEMAGSIDTYIEQHKERWASKGGSIFHEKSQSGFLKDVALRGAEEGAVVVYEVRIDGEVASQQICVRDGGSLRMWKIGMNDRFKAYIPGYLSVYFGMLEAQRGGFTEYDLGPGEDAYKYKVGGVDRHTHNIQGKRGMVDLVSKASHLPGMRKLTD